VSARVGDAVTIVEVGPRDGYQGIGPFIPTARKIALLTQLAEAGLRRIEIGSFVSATALPQMRDTAKVLAACAGLPGLDPQVLVPSERRGRDAVEAGVRHLVFVLSVSEAHNRNNVRRTPEESAAEYERLLAAVPPDTAIRLDLATAFDCPFEGRIPEGKALVLLKRLVSAKPDAEICLCDTTGRADPAHVASLFGQAQVALPQAKAWALHAHDTYGLGLANVHAAYREGVKVFDASFAGLGGCPFAPGATGNVATEDLAWMFARMGVQTGLDIPALIAAAQEGAALPGGLAGGRVRAAMTAGGICEAQAPTSGVGLETS
jgi:hydroxymethylglutaryl-CoA lyase